MSNTTTALMNDGVSTANLTVSEQYDLVANERRRLLIDVLVDRPTALSLECLAATLAEREMGEETPSEDLVERIAISLHHAHLPKLDDYGVIDYDAETNWIDPSGISAAE